MKIDSTKNANVSKAKKTKKGGSSSGSDFAGMVQGGGEAEETASAGSAGAPTGVEGLFSLQEVDDPTAERKSARIQGETILEQLEDLRLAILLGEIPKSKLEKINEVIQHQKKTFTDPRLKEILLEIELRARVELAKYSL